MQMMMMIDQETAIVEGLLAPFGTPCPWVLPDLIAGWYEGQIARLAERGTVVMMRSGRCYVRVAICDGRAFALV